MRRLSIPVLVLALGFFAAVPTAPATAQGWCGAWGFFGNPWSVYAMEQPPYFALHPPVYYSLPVPRTYGYSPFPYGPDVMTPELLIEPETTLNPYVPQQPSTQPTSEQNVASRRPKVITNPYVTVSQPAAEPTDPASATATANELADLLAVWAKLSDEQRTAIRQIIAQ